MFKFCSVLTREDKLLCKFLKFKKKCDENFHFLLLAIFKKHNAPGVSEKVLSNFFNIQFLFIQPQNEATKQSANEFYQSLCEKSLAIRFAAKYSFRVI